MKTIQRSIFRELLVAFFLGLLAFNFVLVTEKVLKLTKLLASVGASLRDMAMIIVYLQPQLTLLTTPMSMLIAVLVTYGRLNVDNEIVVMRTSGMPFRGISGPVFALGAGCFVLGSLASFLLAPAGARNLRETVSDTIARRAPGAIEEGIFNTAFGDVVVYVNEKTEGGDLRGIFVYDKRKEDRPAVMYAARGRVSPAGGDGGVSLDLADGHIYILRGESTTDISFGRYKMVIPFGAMAPGGKHDELSPGGLLKEAGAASGKRRVELLLEFHRRLSMPALCLVLMFLGPPLALMSGKTGKLGGLTLGLFVFAAYYAALTYAENLAVSGKIPHYAGAWGPAAALAAFSLWMFRREEAK